MGHAVVVAVEGDEIGGGFYVGGSVAHGYADVCNTEHRDVVVLVATGDEGRGHGGFLR